MIDKKEEGLRYNDGKNRHDLLEPFAIDKLAEVFTVGAKKYAENNWLKGMKWSKVTASLKRHLNAYEQGIDYDEETGLLHAAHIAWNAMALISYYKYYPQGDDRLHTMIKQPRVSVDVDEICADYLGDWCKMQNLPIPNSWQFDRTIKEKFNEMAYKGELDQFYSNLKVLTSPNDFNFEPTCYITARPVDSKITENWLDKNGFPQAPVYTVGINGSKLETVKNLNIDIHIDDNYTTFCELNANGVCCYLFTAEHNKKFNVGHKRVNSMKEFLTNF